MNGKPKGSADMTLFYLRETHSYLTRKSDGTLVLSKQGYTNKPILRILARDKAHAERLASMLRKERIAHFESKGFVFTKTRWLFTKDNSRTAYSFNIFVSFGCRRCNTGQRFPDLEHVHSGRCFRCGGSGDEEHPLNIQTGQELYRPKLDIPLKMGRPQRVVAAV